jgi:hypothetical protein
MSRGFRKFNSQKEINENSYEDSLKEVESFGSPLGICEVGKQTLNIDLNFSTESDVVSTPKFGDYVSPEVCATGSKSLTGLLNNKTINSDSIIKNRLSFVISCLNGDLESPLYKLIREDKGLSYFSALEVLEFNKQLAIIAFASTDKPKELAKTYEEFFSGDLSRHLTVESFEITKDLINVKKRKIDIIPQGRVKYEFSSDPFAGLDDFKYEDAIKMLDYFKLMNFELINK